MSSQSGKWGGRLSWRLGCLPERSVGVETRYSRVEVGKSQNVANGAERRCRKSFGFLNISKVVRGCTLELGLFLKSIEVSFHLRCNGISHVNYCTVPILIHSVRVY